MILRIKYIGEDDWGRRSYINVDRPDRVYKDVDGVLHTSTKCGEPECPILNELIEVY